MISEDQLEQLAIQCFQDTGWNCVHGAVIAPEGVAAEREDFRVVVLKVRFGEVRRRGAMPGQVRVPGAKPAVTKPEPRLVRPFSAWIWVGDGPMPRAAVWCPVGAEEWDKCGPLANEGG